VAEVTVEQYLPAIVNHGKHYYSSKFLAKLTSVKAKKPDEQKIKDEV